MSDQRYGHWMISYKGNRLYTLDLRVEDIDVEEIAHSLSNICRFGGHCREFYSVAQHSVIVSSLLPDDLKLEGLLHDASEAYTGDMVRPLKQHMPEFCRVEHDIQKLIAARFGLSPDPPVAVQIEDARTLLIEKRDLLAHHEHRWEFPQCAFPDLEIPSFKIVPMLPRAAEELFMLNFRYLTHPARNSSL